MAAASSSPSPVVVGTASASVVASMGALARALVSSIVDDLFVHAALRERVYKRLRDASGVGDVPESDLPPPSFGRSVAVDSDDEGHGLALGSAAAAAGEAKSVAYRATPYDVAFSAAELVALTNACTTAGAVKTADAKQQQTPQHAAEAWMGTDAPLSIVDEAVFHDTVPVPTHVVQWRVVAQDGPLHRTACGYFALHNVQTVMASLRALALLGADPKQPRLHAAVSAGPAAAAAGAVTTNGAASSSAVVPQCSAEQRDALHLLRGLSSSRTHFYLQTNAFHRALRTASAKRSAAQRVKGFWDAPQIDRREMQRPHMHYCLGNLPDLHSLGGTAAISSVPSISLREMTAAVMNVADAWQLQQVFDGLRTARAPVLHAFLIGAGDHWVAVVVNRYRADAALELVYLESSNFDVVSCTDAELAVKCRAFCESKREAWVEILSKRPAWAHLSKPELHDLLNRGNPYPNKCNSFEEIVDATIQRWTDSRHAIYVIRQCVTGTSTLPSIYLDALVDGVCDAFKPKPPPTTQPAAVAAAMAAPPLPASGPAPAAGSADSKQAPAQSTAHAAAAAPTSAASKPTTSTRPGMPSHPEPSWAASSLDDWLHGRGERLHPSEIRAGLLDKLQAFGCQALSPAARTKLERWLGRVEGALPALQAQTATAAAAAATPKAARLVERLRDVAADLRKVLRMPDAVATVVTTSGCTLAGAAVATAATAVS